MYAKAGYLIAIVFVGLLAFSTQSIPPNSGSYLQETATPTAIDLTGVDIFFTRLSEDCHLPCWNNLRVGTSSERELLTWLQSLEFDSGVAETPVTPTPYNAWLTYQDMYNNDILSRVRVTGFVNEDVLYGLNIHWSDLFVTVMPPKRILEEMGTPTNVFVGLGSGRNYISAKLWLEYPELNTYFVYSTAVFFEAPHILCLNPQEWIDEDLEVGLNAIIFSPEADALQLFLLRRSKTGFDIGSLEQATRYTPETFTEYVLTEEDSCIEVDSDSLVFYE